MIKSSLRRRTKIVCTLGPATESVAQIEGLIRSGMNVVRLNLSHGTYESHAAAVTNVRKSAERLGADVAILMDLPGPKYRTGKLKNGQTVLKNGAKVTLTTRNVTGDETLVPVSLPTLPQDARPGARILINDGAIELKVLAKTGTEVICRVVAGGILTERRGLVVPGMPTSGPFLTDDLTEHLNFSVRMKPDYLAISFVSSADDVNSVKEILRQQGAAIPVISKIERVQAVRQFSDILAISDGIMVARGDLGLDIPLERVPLVQKDIIRRCNRVGKPVITATQMLESMVSAPSPTRAEVTDVANAIFDGTDAIMLSGETTVGKYPLAAVKMMAKIALETEKKLPYALNLDLRSEWIEPQTDELISYNACYTAAALGAKAIVTITQTGSTARRVSKYRPFVPVIGLTPDTNVCGRLILLWGVYPIRVSEIRGGVDRMFSIAAEEVAKLGLAKSGDLIVITGGIPAGKAGATDLLKVQRVK